MDTGYFGNYQLLGDSQFVRFCVEILNLKSTMDETRRAQIGFCISGQDSTELAKLISENYENLHDNLIIMIGTNDVKKEVPKPTFVKAIRSIKKLLEWKSIIWLTIPPLPKFKDSAKHLWRVKYFNNEIMRLNGGNVRVIDAHDIYLDENENPREDFFEEYFWRKKPPYREDKIHLNKKGIIRLCLWLCLNLLPQKLDVIEKYRERRGEEARVKIYQEYLHLSKLLPKFPSVTCEELFNYILGPKRFYSSRLIYRSCLYH